MEDTTAPEFTFVPADYTGHAQMRCLLDDATAWTTGEVTIETAGDAAGNYVIVRTLTRRRW